MVRGHGLQFAVCRQNTVKGAYRDYRLKNVICFMKYLIYLQIDFRKLHHRSPYGFEMTANCNFILSTFQTLLSPLIFLFIVNNEIPSGMYT